MELSFDGEFVLADSSFDDDSDVENLLANHRQHMLVVLMAIKEYEDRRRSQRRGSKIRFWLRQNRHRNAELQNIIFCFAVPHCGVCSAAAKNETAKRFAATLIPVWSLSRSGTGLAVTIHTTTLVVYGVVAGRIRPV
ncbi:DNA-directed RNA polymerase 3, chloroplastic [Hordeum vulgare]|nr:DNA-directed RNA polymerase 3, chloroplastic [Hordeum vulgare]